MSLTSPKKSITKKRKIKEIISLTSSPLLSSDEIKERVFSPADDLQMVKKLSEELFTNQTPTSLSSITSLSLPVPVHDLVEVKELDTTDVIITIEDLVMKFVRQILEEGAGLPSCLVCLISDS